MENIHIETFGCTLNYSDSEVMSGLLKEAGFKIVKNEDEADLFIVNSCIVKSPTENKVKKRIRELLKKGKPVVLAGCMAQVSPVKGVSVIGTHQIRNIVEVVIEALNGNQVVLIAEENNERLNLPKIRRNGLIEIIPISKGCLGDCSFCITNKARGKLVSYEKQAIIEQARSAVSEGIKELWLTSQDCSAYGKDIGSGIVELLRDIIKIEGDFRVRVGMMNPNHVMEIIDELVEVFMDKKLYKFFHLPVQSGNDRVLKLMNRRYTVDDFKDVVSRLRKGLSKVTISTDIICGFPTETNEEFQDSLELIKEVKPDVLNISRYWRRPGTKAAAMQQWSGGVTKNRSRKMTELFNKIALENNIKWINWRGSIYIDEKGTLKDSFVGRNFAYKPVVVLSEKDIIGNEVDVKIVDATKYDLRGKIV